MRGAPDHMGRMAEEKTMKHFATIGVIVVTVVAGVGFWMTHRRINAVENAVAVK